MRGWHAINRFKPPLFIRSFCSFLFGVRSKTGTSPFLLHIFCWHIAVVFVYCIKCLSSAFSQKRVILVVSRNWLCSLDRQLDALPHCWLAGCVHIVAQRQRRSRSVTKLVAAVGIAFYDSELESVRYNTYIPQMNLSFPRRR